MTTVPDGVELSWEERAPVRWWPQLAALLLIVVELGWVVPWYQMISGLSATQPLWKVATVLGGCMLSAYAVSLAVDRLRIVRNVKLTILSILLVINLLVSTALLLNKVPVGSRNDALYVDPGFLSTVAFTIWLWRRGIALGSELVRPQMAWNRFQVGLIALMAHTFIAVNLGLPAVGIGGYLAYMFTGLLAVILSRISYVSLTRSARKNPFDRRWTLSAAIGLGATLFFAALAASLLTGQFRALLDGLRTGLQWLFIAVLFIASLPAILISYIFLPLAPLLEGYIQRFFEQQEEILTNPYPFDPYPLIQEAVQPRLPVQLQIVCFWLTLAVILILVLLRVRQTYQQTGVLVLEGPESMLSEGDARRLAKRAFQDFLDGLINRFRPEAVNLPAERIRRIYIKLLNLSESYGHPRPENRTPLEFLPELEETFSATNMEAEKITRAYLDVRYGEQLETPEDVAASEKALDRIESVYTDSKGKSNRQ